MGIWVLFKVTATTTTSFPPPLVDFFFFFAPFFFLPFFPEWNRAGSAVAAAAVAVAVRSPAVPIACVAYVA